MIPGLYYQLGQKQEALRQARAVVRKAAADPRRAHEAGVTAELLTREIVDLGERLNQAHELVATLGQTIRFLAASKFQSHQRQLALDDLESAQSRILREIGDKI